jgi:hypothetical protein
VEPVVLIYQMMAAMNWEMISTQSFHVCQKAKKGNKVFLAGSNGKIAMLNTP